MVRILIAMLCLAVIPVFSQTGNGGFVQHRRTVSRPADSGGGGSPVAPGIDAGTSKTNFNSAAATNVTWSHTVSAGANRALLVMVSTGDGGGAKRVTQVLYNGAAQFTNIGWTNDANFVGVEMWIMTNAPVGTANLDVQFGSGVDIIMAAGINLTNVQQVASPFGGVIASRGTSTSPSETITSSSLQLPVGILSTDQQGTLSVTAGTEIWEYESIGGDVDGGGATVTGAASATITWSTDPSSGENSWCIMGASILAP